MSRFDAVSDVDFYESCNPMHRTKPEPAPIIESPAWWQAEYARIAAVTVALAEIRAERERVRRGD